MSSILRLAVLVMTIMSGTAAQAEPIARLILRSQPDDFVGQGQSFHHTYPTSGVTAQVRRLANGEPAELVFQLTPAGATYALLFFGTDQLGIAMQVGEYLDAERADFASPGHPGLDVSFQHRGCNQVTGSFTVMDATFTGQTIGSFAARFEQHCEGQPPTLVGFFQYQREGEFEPLVPGFTAIRRTHVVELRARVASLQVALALSPTAFTDATLTAGVSQLRAAHVSELRSTLAQVYQAAGRQPPGYADPNLSAGVAIRSVHISELRAAVMAIEELLLQ